MDEPMKILILTQTFPLTPQDSTAHFMYDFARGLAQIGEKVTVFLPYHPHLKPKLFQNVKITSFKYIWPSPLHLLGFGRTLENDQKLRWFVYLLAPFYFLFGTLALFLLVRKEKPDIINAHWILPGGFIAAIVSRLTGVRLFISLAGSDVYLARRNILFWQMALFVKRQATKLISNSPQLLSDFGARGEVISYGVPVELNKKLPQAPRHQKTKFKKVLVATAGRPVEKKGFALLQRLIPGIEIVSDLPVGDFRKKLLEVDIFIALSLRDSKGNLDDSSLTVLEAMAAGCAVIASDFPGYRRIIQNGRNGLLVSPDDEVSINNAVKTLRRSGNLRYCLGRKARQTIAASFTPDKIAKKYRAIFSSSLSK